MDIILYWNAVALEANRQDHSTGSAKEQTGPVMSARALGIIHLAIYDAFFGVHGGFPTYTGTPAAPSLDLKLAVGSAAYNTLVALYPSQQPFFDERLTSYSLQFGVTLNPNSDSFKYGKKIALAILRMRAKDITGDGRYTPSNQPYFHRVDPSDPKQGFYGPAYGANKPFATASNNHQLNPPPAGATQQYKDALHQVIEKGGALGQPGLTRTPDETLIGLFWAYDGANQIGTPPRLYNQIVAKIAGLKGNNEAQNAELFARVNVALADAGIFAWREKYRYELWRPVLGVREKDPFTGPDPDEVSGRELSTESNPFWLPLGAPRTNTNLPSFTPNFPAYPSGHATFGAAALQTVRLFYGVAGKDYRQADALSFDFVSDELNGKSVDNNGVVRTEVHRHFDGLWQAIQENGKSRVYLGVHWEFDAFAPNDPSYANNVGGIPLGLAIAEDIFARGNLQPSP